MRSKVKSQKLLGEKINRVLFSEALLPHSFDSGGASLAL